MGLASQKFYNAADGCWYEVSNSKEWHEEDHPRDESGRFTDGNGDGKKLSGTYQIEDGNGYYDVVHSDGKYYVQQYIRDASGKRKDVGKQKVMTDLPDNFKEVKKEKSDDLLNKFEEKAWKSGQKYQGATFDYNGAQIDARKDDGWIVGKIYAPEGKKIKGTADTWTSFEVREKDFDSYIKSMVTDKMFVKKD